MKILNLQSVPCELLNKVMAMDAELMDFPWKQKQWREAANDHLGRFYLAIDGGQESEFLGFILLSWGPQDSVAHLLKIAVSQTRRRCGIGRKMLETLVDLLPPELESIYLEVAQNNKPALSFYEKCGFEKLHLSRQFYSNGQDAWKMSKPLKFKN